MDDRWTPRKREVAQLAIGGGLIPIEQALALWRLTYEELGEWGIRTEALKIARPAVLPNGADAVGGPDGFDRNATTASQRTRKSFGSRKSFVADSGSLAGTDSLADTTRGPAAGRAGLSAVAADRRSVLVVLGAHTAGAPV